MFGGRGGGLRNICLGQQTKTYCHTENSLIFSGCGNTHNCRKALNVPWYVANVMVNHVKISGSSQYASIPYLNDLSNVEEMECVLRFAVEPYPEEKGNQKYAKEENIVNL